jgi:hypothetical protein
LGAKPVESLRMVLDIGHPVAVIIVVHQFDAKPELEVFS